VSPGAFGLEEDDVIFGKRVIIASLAAATVMILLQMWGSAAAGLGFWAPPVLISAVALRNLQGLIGAVPAEIGPFLLGLVIHFLVCLGLGAIFANTVRDRTGIPAMTYGAAYGLLVFLIGWYLVLPWANVALFRMPAWLVGLSFALFGALLGGSLAWLGSDRQGLSGRRQPSF
jgi:hypothetical protein